MNELSTGWLLLLSWDLLPSPALWPPCAEPQDLHSLQVWASLCAEVSGARLASKERTCQVCPGREHGPQRGVWGSPHTSSVGGESTARDTDLSECPLTSGVDLSPHNVLKSPRQQ